MIIISRIISCFLPCLFLAFVSTPQASETENTYHQALESAYRGQYDTSLSLLGKIAAKQPRYRFDYIQILGWAGRDREVLEAVEALDPGQVPAYVLETAGRSARNLGRLQLSERLFRRAVSRFPNRIPATVGLSMVLSDMGRSSEAIELLRPLAEAHPDDTDILLALGYAYLNLKRWFPALAVYDRILRLSPGHREALRRRILTLDKMGAAKLALDLARRHPGLVSTDEMARLRWDSTAYLIRWGSIYKGDETNRFDEIDRAIRQLQDNLEFSERLGNEAAVWRQRARFDLMVALRARYQMTRVLEQYDLLRREHARLPAYALTAAADACLYLERPEQALELYRQVLQRNPGSFDAQIGVFYALTESEKIAEATRWIDRVAKQQPAALAGVGKNGRRHRIVKGNPRKTQAAALSAMARAYDDRLEEAQRRLESLSANAPFNQNLRNQLATVYFWRGWPRAAQHQLDIGLAHDPRNLGLRVAKAGNLLELRRYREAEQITEALAAVYPENKQVQRQQRRWASHNSPELRLTSMGGSSTGGTFGSQNAELDTYLFSPPLHYHYRPFIHGRWGFGDFPEGRGGFHREGIGMEYTRPAWRLSGEIHHTGFEKNKIGFNLSGSHQFDDHLSAFLGFERVSALTPIRAFRNNVSANSVSLGIDYRVSESRAFSLGHDFLDFSDDNQRWNVSLSYLERLYTSAKYKLDSTVSLYGSANSRANVTYFNPKRTASVSFSLKSDFLTYRRYDLSFHQELILTLGGNWQKHFGTDPVGGMFYRHRWQYPPRFELIYGVGGDSPVYDGTREYRIRGFLQLNWRI